MNSFPRSCRTLMAAALCSAAAARGGEALPTPFAATYEGRKTIAMLPARAVVELRLLRVGGYLVYTMSTRIRWAVVERAFRDCSVLAVDDGALRPLEYHHLDLADSAQDVRTRFDWAQRIAVTQLGIDGAPLEVALTAPTWDPMSYQVALMVRARHSPPGDLQTHLVIERGVLKEHRASMAAATTLKLRGRSHTAHEIVSRKGDKAVVLHLGPELGWRPLRLALEGVALELVDAGTEVAATAVASQRPRCTDFR